MHRSLSRKLSECYIIAFIQDTPDSPKDESHNTLEPGRGEKEGKRHSRHLLFTTHFPLPQVRMIIELARFFE
jgi:hypothetical protein